MDILQVKEKKTYLENYYNKVFSTFDSLTNYYNLSFDVGKLPADVSLYTPPTARRHIDTAVDHILGLGIRATMNLWSESQKAKVAAGDLELFGNAVIKWLQKQPRFNIIRSLVKHGFLYGMFCLRGPIYVPRLRPKAVKKMSEEDEREFQDMLTRTFPFHFRPVHPKNILIDPGEKPLYVIEKSTRTALSIKYSWPDWNQGDLKDTDDVEYWEYWDNNEKQCFADDKEILSGEGIKNEYGFIPYEIGYSGFGLESDTADPADLIVSMISACLESYKAEARMKTAAQAHLEYNAFGRPVIDKKPDADFYLPSAPGEIAVAPQVYKLQNYAPAQINPDFYRWMSLVQQDQERVLPSAVAGDTSGTTSGYQLGISVGQGRIMFDGVKKDLERVLANVLQKMLVLVKDVVMEPVGVTGGFVQGGVATIKPNQLDYDAQQYEVTIEAELPEEKDRRIMLGESLLRTGALSWETICRDYFGRDPEEERGRMLVEAALENPMVKEALAIAAVQNAGMHEVLQLIQEGKLPSQQGNFASQQQQGSNNTQQMTPPREGDYNRKLQRSAPGTGEQMSIPEARGAGNV